MIDLLKESVGVWALNHMEADLGLLEIRRT